MDTRKQRRLEERIKKDFRAKWGPGLELLKMVWDAESRLFVDFFDEFLPEIKKAAGLSPDAPIVGDNSKAFLRAMAGEIETARPVIARAYKRLSQVTGIPLRETDLRRWQIMAEDAGIPEPDFDRLFATDFPEIERKVRNWFRRLLKAEPSRQSDSPDSLEQIDVAILAELAKGIALTQNKLSLVRPRIAGLRVIGTRLSYLKKLGYVDHPPGRKKRGWVITSKGRDVLEKIQQAQSDNVRLTRA